MNPDEILLMDWLVGHTANKPLATVILNGIKTGTENGRNWIQMLRHYGRWEVEGATAALNAAERLYAKSGK